MFMSLCEVNLFTVLERTALPNTQGCINSPYVQKFHRRNCLTHKFSLSGKNICKDPSLKAVIAKINSTPLNLALGGH
jgi:hypothetical protein